MSQSLTLSHPSAREERNIAPVEVFPLLKRMYGYMRPYGKMRNRLIAITILRAVQLSLVSWAFAAVIDGPIARHDFSGLMLGSLAFLGLAAFTQLTMFVRVFYALVLGESIIRDLRGDVFARLQTLTAAFFQKMKAGRILSRMTGDVEAVRVGVQDVGFICLINVGQMLVTAVLLATKDWVLFLVAVAIAPAVWSLNRAFRTRLSNSQRRSSESFSRVMATVAESIDGIRVTQGFVRQEVNAEWFRHLVQDHSRHVMNASRTNAIFLPLLDLNTQLFTGLLLLAGSYRVLYQGEPLGTVVQFLFMANLFFDPLRIIGTQYQQALTSLVGAERVFRLLDEKPDWSDDPAARDLPPITGRVEFRNLGFGYDPARPVLHELSFIAEPGQTVALVGHTGSGKSSIVNLLTKAYLPTSGELLIDGHEIRCVRSASLRRQLGIVQQQNFLFTGSVLENIRFSKPEASEEEVREAARSLDLLDLLLELPQGLQTVVGEGGSGLSVGQRQVVCFTRALLADPRILILDEATSSIDAMTEARLQKALALLLRGRTSFVVAHRLSTIRRADLILVLDHGRIVERGTHEELVARRGIYNHLHEQFLRNTTTTRRSGLREEGAPLS